MTEDLTEYMHETNLRLSKLVEPLELILKDVEPNFLQLGKEFQSIHSDTDALTQLSVHAAQAVGGGSEQDFLTRVGDLAGQSLEQLERCRAEVTGSLTNVEEGVRYLEQLQKMCPVIRNIAKTLNIIALNIAMESSRSRESQEMFSFFVNEIKELSNRVNAISRDIHEDSGTARLKQLDIYRSVAERRNKLAEIAGTGDKMLKDSIKRIEQLMGISAKALEETGERSRVISGHMGEVVVALQFHDITRQQIEHVIEAIQDIKKKYDGKFLQTINEPAKAEVLSQTMSILTLQAAQVRQVIEEISEANENLSNSFCEIGNEIEALVEGTANLCSKNSIDGEKENPFEALLSGFTNLGSILERGHDLAKKIEEAMFSSSEIASRLSQHISKVEDIASDLHIKAINAIIMSNRMGVEGKTHAILAQDVTEVSKNSNEFVSDVVKIIKSIAELAHELSCLSVNEEEDHQGDNGEKGGKIATSIEQISSTYRKFQEDTSMTFERSKALKDAVLQAESSLSFLRELIDQLAECLKGIEQVIQLLDTFKGKRDDPDGDFDKVSERYTMQIERDVHEQIIEESSNTGRNFEEKKECDYFGDNVELF